MSSTPSRKRREKKERVTLFVAIEPEQYEALRRMGYEQKCSRANLVREALDMWLASRQKGASSAEETPPEE